MPRFQAAQGQPERRLNYREVREQQQQQIEQLMKQHMEQQQQQQQSAAATPDRIAKLEEDAKKFAQGEFELPSKGAFSLRISSSTAKLKKEAAAPPTPTSSSSEWRTKDERPIPPYPGQAPMAVEKQPEHPPQPSQQQPVKEPLRRDFGRDSRTPERCKPTSSSSMAMAEFDAKKGVKLPIASPPKTAAGSLTIIVKFTTYEILIHIYI